MKKIKDINLFLAFFFAFNSKVGGTNMKTPFGATKDTIFKIDESIPICNAETLTFKLYPIGLF